MEPVERGWLGPLQVTKTLFEMRTDWETQIPLTLKSRRKLANSD